MEEIELHSMQDLIDFLKKQEGVMVHIEVEDVVSDSDTTPGQKNPESESDTKNEKKKRTDKWQIRKTVFQNMV